MFGDKQQSADRWFLSVAVNRPLVGKLTPVTLLVCNSRLLSHSPGQLMSFSQKSDEQVVAVQLGCGRMCSLLKNVPISVYDCMGEYLAQKRKRGRKKRVKKNQLLSSEHLRKQMNAAPCDYSSAVIMDEKTCVCAEHVRRGQLSRPGKPIR